MFASPIHSKVNRWQVLAEELESRQMLSSYFVDAAAVSGGTGASNSPFNSIQQAANVVNAGDRVNVLPGTYPEKVTLIRSGTSTSPIVFQAVGGPVVVTSPAIATWDGTIAIKASHVVFDGINVQDSNWYGYRIEGASTSRISDITVKNMSSTRTYASGVHIQYSNQVAILNSKIIDACIAPSATANTQECITLTETDGFEIGGNEIWNTAGTNGVSNGGEGIDTKGSSKNGLIRDNYIHDIADSGIYLDTGSKQGTGTADDNPMSNITVTRNRVSGTYHGIALASELGGTAENIAITNNVVYDSWENGIVIAGWGGNGPRNWVLIENNTVNHNGYRNTSATWGGGIDVATLNYTNVRIRNNISSDNESWQIATSASATPPPGQFTIENNISWWTTPSQQQNFAHWTLGTGGGKADPLYMNASAKDFSILSTSPAINFGSANEAPSVDLSGNARAGLPDAGAYEYQNAAPTITSPASAAPVTSKTTMLTVLATDDAGELNLSYTWSIAGTPPASVHFSVNGNNDAKNSMATFTAAGIYTLQVTVTDVAGLSTTSSVVVDVQPSLTSIVVSPGSAAVNLSGTQQFTAAALDQFGMSMAMPSDLTWALASGVGSISSSGLYTAAATAGQTSVAATSGAVTSSAVFITVSDLVAPTLVSAVSRKTHGTGSTAVNYDLQLALSGSSAVEARQGGVTRLVFTLSEAIKPADGVLSANEFGISNAQFGSAVISGSTLTLNLTGRIDRKYSTITLLGLTDLSGNTLAGDNNVSVGNLYGDVNGDGVVTSADQLLVSNNVNKPVGLSNFMCDLNLTKLITTTDYNIVKTNLKHVLV